MTTVFASATKNSPAPQPVDGLPTTSAEFRFAQSAIQDRNQDRNQDRLAERSDRRATARPLERHWVQLIEAATD